MKKGNEKGVNLLYELVHFVALTIFHLQNCDWRLLFEIFNDRFPLFPFPFQSIVKTVGFGITVLRNVCRQAAELPGYL